LVLPDSALEKPQKGVVLAVGPGKKLDNGTLVVPDVSVGDTVLYGKYSGTEVQLGGKDYVILRAEDVLGVLTGTKPSAAKSSPSKVKTPVAKKAKPTRAAKPAGKPKAAKSARPVAKAKPVKATKPASKANAARRNKKSIGNAKPVAIAKKSAPSKPAKKGKK